MKEIIGIVGGAGVVGGAYAELLKRNEHNVLICDPKGYTNHDLSELIKFADYIFIAIPTPTDRFQRIGPLISILTDIQHFSYKGVVVILSTILPYTIQALYRMYEPLKILYSPQFFTEHSNSLYADAELAKSKFMIIGHINVQIAMSYGSLLLGTMELADCNVCYTTPKNAAMAKYMVNTFLATKVTFMNEWYQIAKKEEVDWEVLRKLFLVDSRINESHTQVPGPDGRKGYGGSCFPKDLEAILSEYHDLHVLPNIKEANRRFRG